MIDHLPVDQCANRPPGVHTVEVIPSSLQGEWTEAWNAIHRLRQAARTEEENERALKWILWLPQGLLHTPQRGGKNGARQFRELARRFVMWRQGDMLGLVKAWKMAAVTAENEEADEGGSSEGERRPSKNRESHQVAATRGDLQGRTCTGE